MRPAALLAPLAIAVVLLAGCGGSSQTESTAQPAAAPSGPAGAAAKSCATHAVGAGSLRATGISCDQARQVLAGWQRESSCSVAAETSRASCLTRSYRCLGTRTDRGIAVSCSRAGQSVAFIVRRG